VDATALLCCVSFHSSSSLPHIAGGFRDVSYILFIALLLRILLFLHLFFFLFLPLHKSVE